MPQADGALTVRTMTPEQIRDEPPLCVDLDGTLMPGDSTVRLGRWLALRRPWLVPAMACWNRKSRAFLKQEIARRAPFDAAAQRYNRALLAWLGEEKAQGRRLVLASGSDHRIVAAAAVHLALFDEFLASDGSTNFAGAAKAAGLAARYGTFDYVGNSRKDVAVWRMARRCYFVGNDPSLRTWLGRRVNFARMFPGDWTSDESVIRAVQSADQTL
ncbi:MAG: haloacid dehalogenase-like hydrolase [Stellaceae bacterium]